MVLWQCNWAVQWLSFIWCNKPSNTRYNILNTKNTEISQPSTTTFSLLLRIYLNIVCFCWNFCCSWSVAVIVFAANRTERVKDCQSWTLADNVYHEDYLINRYCPTESFSCSTNSCCSFCNKQQLSLLSMSQFNVFKRALNSGNSILAWWEVHTQLWSFPLHYEMHHSK